MAEHKRVGKLRCMTDPMKVFASCVRGHLVSAPEKNLLALDFAGIESRVTAWLAGEMWKLDAFRAYDAGTGPDTYKLAYARAFRVPVESIGDDDPRRQVGKVMELSLGYQGGVGAFTTMTKTYGVKLDELADTAYPILPDDVREEAEFFMEKNGTQGLSPSVFVTCDSLKRLWRRAHPRIVDLWQDMQKAAVYATSNPGKVYSIPSKKIRFCTRDRWLYMGLPSGRRIAYFEPEINEDEQLTYMGVHTKTRQWTRVTTYGGKLVQNAGEGVPRDLLVHGILAAEAVGYSTVMTVHDEAVFEVDEGFGSLEEARALMCATPTWAKGLPVTAKGFIGRRYKK